MGDRFGSGRQVFWCFVTERSAKGGQIVVGSFQRNQSLPFKTLEQVDANMSAPAPMNNRRNASAKNLDR